MTTITTDMLHSIAHTLGVTPGELAFILDAARLSVTIDDTPADTEEQSMAMTITQADLRRIPGADKLSDAELVAFAQYFGYIITTAEPPAEMVKLAREIVAKICDQQQQVREVMIGGWDDHAVMRVALAALQRVVDVVKKAETFGDDSLIDKDAILNALGAGGRDAG